MLYMISLYYGWLIDSWAYPSIYPIVSHSNSHEKPPFFSLIFYGYPMTSNDIFMTFSMEIPICRSCRSFSQGFSDGHRSLEGATGGGGLRHRPCGKLPAQHRGHFQGMMGWIFFFLVIFRCTWGCCFRFWWTCGRFAWDFMCNMWVV